MESTRSLTILFDESCALCRRCRDWLLTQPCLVPVQLVPAGSPLMRARYQAIEPWLGKELVAVDDAGHVWVGPAAFITCLWATARYRAISYTLARPALAPFAERFFMFVSKRRDRFGRWIHEDDAECSWCDGVIVTHNQS
ncbi:MAG TPA: DCC1-like thiol-disulfide oxidoreductase family protein [Actinomycetota bacterium]|nr:DCC1-like thiol-disulfide oxidoreductase family protein [Actinomycetota bacterium]